jgi:hypothetical protein
MLSTTVFAGVCKIGSTEFDSLQEALDYVGTGYSSQKITLCRMLMSRTGFPCDSVGVNYLANGRRTRVNLSSPTAQHDFNLLSHGELFGDVAIRLMLQRLSYGPKHPPAEVYLDLPKPKPLKKGTEP